MNSFEYQIKVRDLLNPDIVNAGLKTTSFYLITKLASEFGEFAGDYCKKFYHGKDILQDTFIEELGDCQFYFWNLYYLMDLDFQREFYVSVIEPMERGVETFSKSKDCECAIIDAIDSIGYLATKWQASNHSFRFCNEIFDTELRESLPTVCHAIFSVISYLNLKYVDILKNNIDKLEKRHGTTYNPNFYRKCEKQETHAQGNRSGV